MVKAKLRFIDCLRGIAIFGVLLRHLLETATRLKVSHPTLAAYMRSGQYGVQLFFVVSAFTLFLSLDRRRRNERRPWRNYFLRRFFRIAPMFWVALAFYWIWPIGPAEDGSAGYRSWGALAAAATFINDLHPHWINSIVAGGWSVATETLFYLLLPLMFLTIKNLRTAIAFAFIAAVGAMMLHHYAAWSDPFIPRQERTRLRHYYTIAGAEMKAHHIHLPTPDDLKAADQEQTTWAAFIEFWLPNQIPVFALGCVLFFLYRKLGEPGRRTEDDAAAASHPPPRRGLAIALLLGAVAILVAGPLHDFSHVQPHVLFGIGAVLLACSLAIWEIPLLVNSFWEYLGKISYSVYLTHWALLWPLADWIGPSMGRHVASVPRLGLILLLLVPLSIALATVTYYLIEQPGQALGKRVIAWLEGAKEPRPVSAAAV